MLLLLHPDLLFLKKRSFLTSLPYPLNILRCLASPTFLPPPRRPYDCGIGLIPGSFPPQGRLSTPERLAMEKYIQESLVAGIIQPISFPARVNFFFVGKKDIGLWPCIDYQVLNDIMMKTSISPPYLNYLQASARVEHLHQARPVQRLPSSAHQRGGCVYSDVLWTH